MPGGDRTGPMGQGSRTGRGMGYCSGYSQPGFMTGLGGGMGLGRGMGRGRGIGARFVGTVAPYVVPPVQIPVTDAPAQQAQAGTDVVGELDALRRNTEKITQLLDTITERIENLEKSAK